MNKQLKSKNGGDKDKNNMAELFKNLKPDDVPLKSRRSSSSEDEDASRFVDRRKSMNEVNEVGHNFQKY
jgi:hypothetical protein